MSFSQKSWGSWDLSYSGPDVTFGLKSKLSCDSNHCQIPLRPCCLLRFFFPFLPPKAFSFKQPHFPRKLPFLVFKPSRLSCFQLVTELWSATSKDTSNLEQVTLPCDLFPSYCQASLFFVRLYLQLLPCASPGYRSGFWECTYHVKSFSLKQIFAYASPTFAIWFSLLPTQRNSQSHIYLGKWSLPQMVSPKQGQSLCIPSKVLGRG